MSMPGVGSTASLTGYSLPWRPSANVVPVNASESPRPPLDRGAVTQVTAYWRVDVVDETESTNADVAQRAKAGEEAGLVLVAEHQTAGRGRLDRSWEAPARAGLTFSVLLRPQVE